jgi:hypothetical protein
VQANPKYRWVGTKRRPKRWRPGIATGVIASAAQRDPLKDTAAVSPAAAAALKVEILKSSTPARSERVPWTDRGPKKSPNSAHASEDVHWDDSTIPLGRSGLLPQPFTFQLRNRGLARR